MIALKAEDVKDFTSKLFLRETFDSFLVKEARITTYNQFSIDGHIRKGYFSPEELDKLEEMLQVISQELMPEVELHDSGEAKQDE